MSIKLVSRGNGDICVRYKPHTFDEVVGQLSTVKSLRKAVVSKNSSQCYLFHGESGCGKSTLAYIMALSLNCLNLKDDGNPCCKCSNCTNIMNGRLLDYKEINAAEATGIDKVRTLIEELKLSPMVGKVKIYVLNEAHGMSLKAQDALLQDMDKMPKGAYIILTSTEVSKIRAPLRNRCESYKFNKLIKTDIQDMVDFVLTMEGSIVSNKIKQSILDKSELRPRNTLKLLQVVLNIGAGDENSIIKALESESVENSEISNLCRLVQRRSPWASVMSTYKNLDMPVDSIYYIMGAWFRSSVERAKTQSDILNKNYRALEFFLDDLPTVKPENKVVHSIFSAWKIHNG